jgi:CRISPR-associated endonuclease/helicase Cas3
MNSRERMGQHEMDLVAHSRETSLGLDYQPLRAHLLQTARLSMQNASTFETGNLAYLIGLFHDFGKASDEFQRRVLGNGGKVDHSTYGAIQALELNRGLGRIAAYCIAGHHAGLPDGTHLDDRIASRESLPGIEPEAIKKLSLDIPKLNSGFLAACGGRVDGFSRSFYIRMLYSALVDADYLDTETFMDPDKGILRQHCYDFRSMIPLVDRYISELGGSERPINIIRSRILSECRAKSNLRKGFFTLPIPTGGGKTLTSLIFALEHAVIHDLDRIIYVIPFTSIIEQNCEVFRRCIGHENVLEHHSNRDPMRLVPNEDQEEYNRLELASENWDAPLVVTTNVQFFESLFANRSSRCRKLHRISNSVIILDEAQMLPTEFLKPCMHALEELVDHYGCSVVLSTATQPVLFETKGLIRSQAVPITLTDNSMNLPQLLRRVEAQFIEVLTDADLAAHIIKREQILCIVNTRRHASELFELVSQAGNTWHLSANMCAEHRSTSIKSICLALKEGRPCRVISTQLVEAGVDLDFPVVFRALAGIDSIVQSAGRCNREGRLRLGKLFVFVPTEGERLRGWLARTAEIGKEVIRHHANFISPEAVNEYFHRLYDLEGDLDSKGIVRSLNEGSNNLSVPFEEIANDFRMIEDNTMGVVVPYRPDIVVELVEQIRQGRDMRVALRKIQRYIVQVPYHKLKALEREHAVEPIMDELYLLNDSRYYRGGDRGLVFSSENIGPLQTLNI